MTVENDLDEEAVRTYEKKCLVRSFGLFAVVGGGTAILSATGVSLNTMLTIATILVTGGLGAIVIMSLLVCCCAALTSLGAPPPEITF